MNHTKYIFAKSAFGFIILLFVITLSRLVGQEMVQVVPEPSDESIDLYKNASTFVQENLPTLSHFVLSNGIPVVLKKNEANRVQHISLFIKNGTSAARLGTAGYENLALSIMVRSSQNYSREVIEKLLDDTSSSISVNAQKDYSSVRLNTLDKYLEKTLPVWADILANPKFASEDFTRELSQFRLNLQNKELDPWSKVQDVGNQAFFKTHPYANSPEGTEKSLSEVTLEKLKSWYTERFKAESIFIVAVGNFDAVELKDKLEVALSGIANGAKTYNIPPTFNSEKGDGTVVTYDFPQSEGVAYVYGIFPAPFPTDEYYFPLKVGLSIFDDLLFDVVRSGGAVYSPGTLLGSNLANYGIIYLYKTQDPSLAKQLVDDATDYLRASKIPSKMQGQKFRTIGDLLESYKGKMIAKIYEDQATNAAIANSIGKSIILSKDYRNYLLDADRINAITEEQVVVALNNYLFGTKIEWTVLGAQDVLSIDETRFTTLGTGIRAKEVQ